MAVTSDISFGELYTPSAWQTEYHNLDHEEALGAGSAGPGKSLCLLWDPMYQVALEHQRCKVGEQRWGASTGRALHLRRTFRMLTETLVRAKEVFPLIDPKVKFSEKDYTYRFSSGYHYQFGHCHYATDWENYQSNQYTHIAFDEAVQFMKIQYDMITARLRSPDKYLGRMLRVRLMSNPVIRREQGESFAVDNPFWVRDIFVKPAPQGRVTITRKTKRANGQEVTWRRIYLPAKLSDNPNPAFVENYEKNLLNKPAYIRKTMLEGNWFTSEFSYYGDYWDPKIHTCMPFEIPYDWPCFRSLDWGFRSWGCVGWYAMDEDGRLWKFYELSFKEMTVKEVGARIRDIELAHKLWDEDADRSRISGPADTQLWEERGDEQQFNKGDEFFAMGIPWERADKKSRASNAMRLIERLKSDQKGMCAPGIVFFKRCFKTIATIPSIMSAPNDIDLPLDSAEDHWHDETCYAVAYATHGRGRIRMRPVGEGRKRRVMENEDLGVTGYG